MDRLKGKIILITGASLGIGKAVAQIASNEGAYVILTDVNDRQGKELEKDIIKSGGKTSYFHMNVSKENDVRYVFEKVKKKIGDINILVNNAGILGADKPTDQLSEKDWDDVFAINVMGVFFCTKYAIPQMIRAGGSIVNIASISGIVANTAHPPYHASKAAVRMMTKTDAILYAKNNIRVNCVSPGKISTPMLDSYLKTKTDEEKSEILKDYPLGRVGDSSDVAYAVIYLASDEAKFVTGSEIVVDGGFTAR